MKKIFILFMLLIILPVKASIFQGEVTENSSLYSNRIIDSKTGEGIDNAHVTLPKQNYHTKTDKNGYFELETDIEGTSIMSVQKDNYKPFSMTINEQNKSTPIVVSIEKSNSSGLAVDTNMYHLGDNNYSEDSANAGQFQFQAIGPFYTKRFILKNIRFNQPVYLSIGSIIGIDTAMARSLGQNRIANAYASPPEIYFNGNKVSEIQINGDGQKIKLPSNLIKHNAVNEITIKTGRNLMQTAYIDYDDIEFMNLYIDN